MAQTGYTPILIYSSSTGGNAPAAGNLTNSTLGSELAINITDGKLFYKDNANAIQVIGWKTTPTTAGGTGLTGYTAGDLLYYASGTTLSKLAIGTSGQWLGSSGTAPQWNSPAALTKTDDTNVTLTLGGSASTALLNAASLTLGWTGQLAVTRGGTGLSSVSQGDILYGSAANTLSALAKNTTATRYLSNTGTSNNPAWAQVDLTNGVTGTLPVGNGGTGQTSWTANGLVYASSTSALATSSGVISDGTRVGINSTIQSWFSTFVGIDFGGGSLVYQGTGATFLTQNSYLDTGVTWRYRTTNPATYYTQNTSGQHAWFVAASGTAGSAISWTQAQTIHNSGGISIGNTTDPGATNLSVTGTITAAKLQTLEGVSGSIANGATATLFALPSAGSYLVVARQDGAGNGGIRAAAIVMQGSSSNGLSSLFAVGGATLVQGTGSNVDITNTAGGAATFRWSYTKLSS